ncbi:MAG: Sir2 family NAD-dependent protein deacetylase [Thermodesulfobacteriota bacterium]|nr:Sir2 family NAD-dependent protein deacetylase [Thermodesulfobacteriota bacterium]
MDKDKINEVANSIVNSENLVALTGTGVSTESGIPDFRSPESWLWSKMIPIFFTRWGFRLRPKAVYKLGRKLFTNIWLEEPAIPHKFLALLEKKGILKGVITKNIDSLHQKTRSKSVIEVNAHLRSGTYKKCKKYIRWKKY